MLNNLIGSGDAALRTYLNYLGKIPLPTKEDEYSWATAYQERNDLEAAQKLILSHLRFVVYIAKRYKKSGLPLNDLIQEGNIGLLKAVKRFSTSYGVRFVTFAVHWIKNNIHIYIMNNLRIMRTVSTKSQRKLYYNLHKFKKANIWLSMVEAQMIAKELKVKVTDVFEMEKRLFTKDVPILSIDETSEDALMDPRVLHLEAPGADPAEYFDEDEKHEKQSQMLIQSLNKLDERSRDIIVKRYLTPSKVTLQDLSEVYNVSMERVRQIEIKVIDKMRQSIGE